MTAIAFVGSDDVCGASLLPYVDCPHDHEHRFSDPQREGRLLAGWGTLHAKPTREPIPYTHHLPGEPLWPLT